MINNDVIAAILTMDSNQLNRVIEAVNQRRQWLARDSARQFRVGDIVSFSHRGMQIVGTVQKLNPKNIMVKQNNSFTVWRVNASLLKPVTQLS
jgi:hypothetical protein